MTDLTLSARLKLDSQNWVQGLTQAQSKTKTFVSGVRREFSALRDFATSTGGMLASLGVGYGIANQLIKSARLDQTLIRVGQTADATKEQVSGLRKEIFRMARQSGGDVEELAGGFNALVQSGLGWNQSLAAIDAVNVATAVTGINATTAGAALQSMAANFDFDLTKPKMAMTLLDQMRVASKLGNAEMEDLAGMFPRFAPSAKAAGLSAPQTLAYVEGLSLLERQPERLATLADSGLRLFGNAQYRTRFSKGSGIDTYNKDGSSRDPLAILGDFRTKYRSFTTDKGRDSFLGKSTKDLDMDLVKMIRMVATGKAEKGQEGMLERMGSFTSQVTGSQGTLGHEMPDAIDNAIAQAGILKTTLREAADGFAQPITAAFAHLVQFTTKSKAEGGLEMTGGQMVATGGALLAVTYGLRRLVGGKLGRYIGAPGDTATNALGGQVAKKLGAADFTVYVVNMPGGGLGGGAAVAAEGLVGKSAVSWLAARFPVLAAQAAAAGAATTITALAGAGVLGYAAGTKAYNALESTNYGHKMNDFAGAEVARILSLFNFGDSREALATTRDNGRAAMEAASTPQAIAERARRRAAASQSGIGHMDSTAYGDRKRLFEALMPISKTPLFDALQKTTADNHRPLRGELDIRLTDTRTTVTMQGEDFSVTRTRSTSARPPRTGRIMEHR